MYALLRTYYNGDIYNLLCKSLIICRIKGDGICTKFFGVCIYFKKSIDINGGFHFIWLMFQPKFQPIAYPFV